MSNPTDIIAPASGMGPSWARAELPRSRCQYARGFTPARRGQMRLAATLKRIQRNFGLTIEGTAVWLSESGAFDRLLAFTGSHIYTTPLLNTWQYDERLDPDGISRQHSFYSLGALGSDINTYGGLASSGVTTAQFRQELIISDGGTLLRYYVSETGADQGTEYLFALGVETPGSPTLVGAVGGSMTNGQTYGYVVTYVDEKQRESSPSPEVSIVMSIAGGWTQVTITQNGGPYSAGGGEKYWNIYRRNPGSKVLNRVTQQLLTTTSYTDTFADDAIAPNPTAPSPGENDPPGFFGPPFRGQSNIMTVWKDRLILNDMLAPNMIQVSNAGSPTQFSSLPLPTNIADGFRFVIGGPGQNEVTGLASLGSLLAMFGREAMDLLYGDDISSFTQRTTLARGCQNSWSVQRCENEILFASDDGIYAVGYEDGYTVQKRSIDIESLFRGFTPTAEEGEPTAIGRLASVQVSNALFGNMNSFYSENRYYLSFGNRTIVYDVQSGGWTDTGWGFVKTATRYLSQMSAIAGSAPESVFLTVADVNDFSTSLQYFTVADTPEDADAPGTVNSSLILRPFDAQPSAQSRTKRPIRLSQYGSTSAKRGTKIGTVKWWGDGTLMYTGPIYAGITIDNPGALFEVCPTPYVANVGWIEMEFTDRSLVLENSIVEMVYCS